MRGRIGQILDAKDQDARVGATADVTMRRFWSQGPQGRSLGPTGQGMAQTIDLAAWKKAATGIAR